MSVSSQQNDCFRVTNSVPYCGEKVEHVDNSSDGQLVHVCACRNTISASTHRPRMPYHGLRLFKICVIIAFLVTFITLTTYHYFFAISPLNPLAMAPSLTDATTRAFHQSYNTTLDDQTDLQTVQDRWTLGTYYGPNCPGDKGMLNLWGDAESDCLVGQYTAQSLTFYIPHPGSNWALCTYLTRNCQGAHGAPSQQQACRNVNLVKGVRVIDRTRGVCPEPASP